MLLLGTFSNKKMIFVQSLTTLNRLKSDFKDLVD